MMVKICNTQFKSRFPSSTDSIVQNVIEMYSFVFFVLDAPLHQPEPVIFEYSLESKAMVDL